jgi:uncharacterized Fe-S cluster-containing radical SAM superfamily enzyme
MICVVSDGRYHGRVAALAEDRLIALPQIEDESGKQEKRK